MWVGKGSVFGVGRTRPRVHQRLADSFQARFGEFCFVRAPDLAYTVHTSARAPGALFLEG
jgi:hypothetical protein